MEVSFSLSLINNYFRKLSHINVKEERIIVMKLLLFFKIGWRSEPSRATVTAAASRSGSDDDVLRDGRVDLRGVQCSGNENESHGAVHPAMQVALDHIPRQQIPVLVVHLVASERPQLHDYHIVEDICEVAITIHSLCNGQGLLGRPTAV